MSESNSTSSSPEVPEGAEVAAVAATNPAEEKIPLDREPDESEIDSFLAAEDPEFFSKLGEIKADAGLKVEEIQEDSNEELAIETAKWAEAKGLGRILFKVFPFIPRLILWRRRQWLRLTSTLVSASIWLKNTSHDLVKSFFRNSKRLAKDAATSAKDQIGSGVRSFKKMSLKLKLMWLFSLLVSAVAIGGIYLALTGKIFPKESDLFVASFQEMGAEEFVIPDDARRELFYDNIRSSPNLLLIPKIVANIQRSYNSGENPMVAVEFFAEGMSPEVILELKDREAFFRDFMQRYIETQSFDALESPVGKRKLTEDLQAQLNGLLTTGQLKAVRIKTIVLKP